MKALKRARRRSLKGDVPYAASRIWGVTGTLYMRNNWPVLAGRYASGGSGSRHADHGRSPIMTPEPNAWPTPVAHDIFRVLRVCP